MGGGNDGTYFPSKVVGLTVNLYVLNKKHKVKWCGGVKGFAKQHQSLHHFYRLNLYYLLKLPNLQPIVIINMGHVYEDGGIMSPVFCCVL